MFANCKEEAIHASGVIPDTTIYYGLYIPKKEPKLWHKNWRKHSSNIFTHFWLEKGAQIIDVAAEQFGEKGIVYTTIQDKHYIKVGQYDKEEGINIPLVKDPDIKWETYTNPNNSVKIIWDQMDKHLATMGV